MDTLVLCIATIFFSFQAAVSWFLGSFAKRNVMGIARRLVSETRRDAEKWLAAGKKLQAEFEKAHEERWHQALAAAAAVRASEPELSEPETVDVLAYSIGDKIEKFTCDGCDSVYRRGFPGYCTDECLEFCSSACRDNPMPFGAPAITVVRGQDMVMMN